MAAPVKSPVREAIEAEVIQALRSALRPLTCRDLLERCETAQDKTELARIVSYMREAGTLTRGPDVEPGQPGGLLGKGARACASYVLTVPVATTPEREADAKSDLDTAAASTNGDEYAHPPIEIDRDTKAIMEQMTGPPLWPTAETPRTESDFAEPDPFDPTEADRWARDVLRLGELSDAALVEIADELLEGDRIWTAVRAMHRHAKQLAADWI